MATRALQQVVCYYAWNTSTNVYVTGDSANHSTSWCKDGTRSATTNATAEVDASNLPGLYKVTMTSTETDCIEGVLGGKSSTSNVVLIGTMVAFGYLNTSAPATAGIPDVNVKNMNNVAATSITTINANQGTTQAITFDGNNLPKVDVVDWAGSAANALVGGKVDAVNSIRTGTAQAGANGSITLDSGASATNNLYNDQLVVILSGTGAGQVRPIIGYVGSTKVASITPNWATNPDNTSVFVLTTAAFADVVSWLQTAVTAATAGIPDTNVKNINNVAATSVTTINANLGTTQAIAFDSNNYQKVDLVDIAGVAVSTSTAQLGVNTVNIAGQAATLDGNNLLEVDVVDIAGSAVATGSAQLGVNVVNIGAHAVALDGNNRLKVDTDDWGGTAVGAIPPDVIFIRSGTAQAGGATTITLDSGASATNNLYQNCVVFIRSGTGAGQSNIIASYVGSTKVATVSNSWATSPDSSSVFTVAAFGPVIASVSGTVTANVTQVNGHDVTDTTSGVLDVNAKNINNVSASSVTTINANLGTTQALQYDGNNLPKVDLVDIAGSAVSTSSAQLGVNAVNIAGQAAALDANNLLKVDVEDWKGGVVPAVNVTGVPLVDLKYTLGTVNPAAAGSVSVDWSATVSKTATVDFTNTTIKNLDGNTVQTGDAYARLGAPAGASVSADIAAVKSDTGTTLSDAAAIKAQTDKMAFTVANVIDANVLRINGNASAAQQVEHTNQALTRCTVGNASSTTSIVLSAIANPASLGATGQLIGRALVFDADTTTTNLQGQATNITNSTTGATPTLTVTALTTAPVSGDTFCVI
jgi:hypothetical protein